MINDDDTTTDSYRLEMRSTQIDESHGSDDMEDERVEPRYVKILYGPYNTCGVVKYKTNRLQGMTSMCLTLPPFGTNLINNYMLEKAGYVVELEEFEDWNSVEVWCRGEKIFTCDIRQLDFGSDGFLDKLCSEALVRVNRSYI